jgi:quercetin dioxygenase-like cupin family protein
MSNRRQLCFTILAVSLILSVAGFAQGQTAGQPEGRNMAAMKFVSVPGLPTCAPGSVQSGDPTKGPSIILAKAAAGCSVPWHWHTPNEHLMIVNGVARLEMKDGKPLTLRAGGFAMMPSAHVHQFRCTTACALYIYSDAAFDIHYLDKEGKEISPEDALKAVKEKTTKPTQ